MYRSAGHDANCRQAPVRGRGQRKGPANHADDHEAKLQISGDVKADWSENRSQS